MECIGSRGRAGSTAVSTHGVARSRSGRRPAAASGAYGIAATPEGDIYYASLAGNHIAKIDKATGAATVIEPPTKAQGARRVWSEFQGQNMGIRMERGAAQVFMTPNEQLARMEIARRSAEGIRCLCRRSRHCLGVGLGCQCDCVVRSYNRSLPKLSLLRGLGERAPDPRTVGRGLAAGIGPGPPRGDQNGARRALNSHGVAAGVK